MTAITLPLKKIPGQGRIIQTFFGGRGIIPKSVLLLSMAFNLYIYIRLSQGILPYYNLIGLLPYFWGIVSIIYYVRESRCIMEMILEAELDEAEKIVKESGVKFRKILVSTCFSSIIMVALFSYLLIAYGMLPLFIIGVSSITSVGIAVGTIISRYELGTLLTYIFMVLTFEVAFLFLALRGQGALNVIFPILSITFVYSCIRQVERYDLRSFFERVIN
jgi:hypothetical protein